MRHTSICVNHPWRHGLHITLHAYEPSAGESWPAHVVASFTEPLSGVPESRWVHGSSAEVAVCPPGMTPTVEEVDVAIDRATADALADIAQRNPAIAARVAAGSDRRGVN